MENKEPTMLLTGLRSFANEIQYRQNVWQWMKKEWSSYVIIPAGKYSNNVLVCTDKQVTPSYCSFHFFKEIERNPSFYYLGQLIFHQKELFNHPSNPISQ